VPRPLRRRPATRARPRAPPCLGLLDSLTDVALEDCPTEDIDFLDDRLGETGGGEPIRDDER